jgi:AraC-like DNA-binding protein
MKKNVMFLNWKSELNRVDQAYSLGNEFFLTDNPAIASAYDYPVRLDAMVAVVCTRGYMKGRINLKPSISEASSVTILLPGQILQYEDASGDFSGYFLVMSKHFADSLMMSMQERISLSFAFFGKPCLPLSDPDMESMLDYCNLLKKTRRIDDFSVRREMVLHLTMAFYYALIYRSNILYAGGQPSKQGSLPERFIKLVGEHFREQREIRFYADRLCLTPKYLSRIVRESSGASAGEWIDRYVSLEAKALLRSSGMTVRQISYELNFPSQSFFGKYFKRVVGVSPKAYRESK